LLSDDILKHSVVTQLRSSGPEPRHSFFKASEWFNWNREQKQLHICIYVPRSAVLSHSLRDIWCHLPPEMKLKSFTLILAF